MTTAVKTKNELGLHEHTGAGFFVGRTPLLPFADFAQWGDDVEAPRASTACSLEAALQRDAVLLRERLRRIVTTPPVREALFVASPGLEDSLEMWLQEPTSNRGQKVERSLTRYLARMATRPTPFGLFAGCSIGRLSSRTRLEIDALARYRRKTRLDMAFVVSLTSDLLSKKEIRRRLRYYPNPSVYGLAGRVRYVEIKPSTGAITGLVTLDRTEPLVAALDVAADVAFFDDIVAAICSDREVEKSDAEDFVDELIDASVLLSELTPFVTGKNSLRELADRLRTIASASDTAAVLSEAATLLDEIDRGGLQNRTSSYRHISSRLSRLETTVDAERLFHVDLTKPAIDFTLSSSVVRELCGLADILHAIGPIPSDRLQVFRHAFAKRYGTRSVPLMEVFDDDIGIGFERDGRPSADPSPLLADLRFPDRPSGATMWGLREQTLASMVERARRAGSHEIALTRSDICGLERTERSPLPDSFAAIVTLVGAPAMVSNGSACRILVDGFMGPSGANLFGRFCHADEELAKLVCEHLVHEEENDPNAIFAEIVHMPEGRAANVVSRPVLRRFEIPCMGRSGGAATQQIPLADLQVSVVDARVVLHSTSLGRRVIPRMTNRHNYGDSNLEAYRFLCSLINDGDAPTWHFTWSSLKAPFFPRVSFGRFVVSRARWHLTQAQLRSLSQGSRAGRYVAMQELRKEVGLPRYVCLTDADNLLPIDLDNTLSIDAFIQMVVNRESARVEELFPEPADLCVTGPEGLFSHELIIPLVRRRNNWESVSDESQRPVPPSASSSTIARTFHPGSEWLFVKLYCGESVADVVLREVVANRLSAIREACDTWFFLRYADPEPHIRLRFHGEPKELQQGLLPAIMEAAAPFVQDRLIWRTQLDTYDRELERYGGEEGMLLAEKVFHVDSEVVLEILDPMKGAVPLEARWQLCLLGIDLTLRDLGLDLSMKRRVVGDLRDSFGKEFQVDSLLQRDIGAKYRTARSVLQGLRDPKAPESHPLAVPIELLKRRSELLVPIAAKLLDGIRSHRISVSTPNVAGSFVHMHANRMLRSNGRAQEFIIYDFLARIYDTESHASVP